MNYAAISMRGIYFFCLLFFFTHTIYSSPLLVVYPEAPEPYREAFEQIVSGVTDSGGSPTLNKMIKATTTQKEFQRWLDDAQDNSIVLLGIKPLNFYEKSQQDRANVFLSGVNALPGQIQLPGISLTIDPMLYLQTLRELLPHIQRVVVYFNHQEESWLISVRDAAKDLNIDIKAVGVTDAFDLARRLHTTFETLDPGTTALWFGSNTIALNSELLYSYILEQTWDRGIAVFSDTIAHVKFGFLFAYYPNYLEIGVELGKLIKKKPQNKQLQFSRTGQLALNMRTCRHLGITLRDNIIKRAHPLFSNP